MELYAIGMGQPQYLCLEIPQSLSLKLIFFCPTFFSSIILIASTIESFGDFKLSKNFELNIIPGSVYAWSVTLNESFSFEGFTTALTFKLYFNAKSKSLWSCAGHPNTAPKP